MTIFGLRKTWVDPGPGISMVQIHYTTSPRGEPPDWTLGDQAVLSPVTDSPERSTVIEVPRDAGRSLHHFFFVVGMHDRTASPVFTEDIVSHDITYPDHEGVYTSVGIMWSCAGVPNYTSTVMDGLPFESAGSSPAGGNIYEFVRAQPLPHVFRGAVWGVPGSTIRYGYHLISNGHPDPSDNTESWNDNDGVGWTVDL
ncbi:hypothetical protein [Actinoplanes sp. URMC 104]|uniref:hypothetical protein n=1 Tax=Actinoplanes sp. URMC 104 TaxID=3423409 RepID=UPI003F1B77D2